MCQPISSHATQPSWMATSLKVMYRQMMWDSRTMSGAVFPFSDLGKTLTEYYLPRGESCPFATAIGLSPLAAMAACAPSPIPEPELVGMLSGEPARLCHS